MIHQAANTEFITVQGAYFDTINTISAWCSHSTLTEAMAQCEKYDSLLSKTVTGSDVWKLNHAKGEAITVSNDTIEILKVAQAVNNASDGAFNIAVGQAVDLWKAAAETAGIINDDELKAVIRQAGCSEILVEGNTVQAPPKLQIDLGGIAKGYIADQVANYLRQRNVNNAMLNFGGNIVTVGSKLDGSRWKIGLQNPFGIRGKDFWAFVESQDSTVVTSGIYERGFEIKGKWYHHILDPRTGYPVNNDLLTVTVSATNSMLADALATALFVLGADKGILLAEKFGVDAVFLKKGGKVTFTKGLNITFVK